jgi:carboxypeptidase PM20D1
MDDYLYILIGLFVILIIIVLVKTIQFKPILYPEMKKKHEIDESRVLESLSQKIKIPTISYPDSKRINKKAFSDFKTHLKERYPLIYEKAIYKEIGSGVLYHIKGEKSEDPTVLMAHFDVVPVEGNWSFEPFSGDIDDTYIHGRGTLDTKSSLNAVMEALEYSLKNKKVFNRDVYISFSGDEEIYGETQHLMVEYFKKQDIHPYMVLDEGGAIVSKMFPGVDKKVAVIGIAEKGFMNIKLTAYSKGGHASTPPKNTALTTLSSAVVKLNKSRTFKMKLTEPVKVLFDTLAPFSKSFPIKMIFANLWLFTPVVKLIAKLSGGELLSMFKTTQAFTTSSASDALNVLPNEASVGINYRLRPHEDSETVVKKIRRVIHNDDIKIEVIGVSEATTTSIIDDAYGVVRQSIKKTWPDVIVTPYLMVATSDSRHYHEICERVYKFSPMDVSKDDLKLIHGEDEKISRENVINGTNFYINLIEKL